MFDHTLVRNLAGALTALIGASLAVFLGMPLPWLLGPLIAVAAMRLSGAPVAAHPAGRSVGQWVIGASLGLYFTVEILDLVGTYWFALLVGMVVPIVLSFFGSSLLAKIGRVDFKTAWFASAIGGASEMSALAERYNARADLVASAHSVRVLTVVVLIPFGYMFFGIIGTDVSELSQRLPDVTQYPLLLVVTILCGFVFGKLRIPNGWVLGPLLGASVLTMLGHTQTTLPPWVVNAGQLLIGWNLGDKYRPDFFQKAPRFLLGVVIFAMLALAAAMAVGYGISLFTDIPLATLWLGLAPGGLAEMTITAKVLNLGVPMVTAFQVSRLVFVVLITGWLYKKLAPHRAPAQALD